MNQMKTNDLLKIMKANGFDVDNARQSGSHITVKHLPTGQTQTLVNERMQSQGVLRQIQNRFDINLDGKTRKPRTIESMAAESVVRLSNRAYAIMIALGMSEDELTSDTITILESM